MFIWSSLHVFAVTTYLYLTIYILAINPRERINHTCAAVMVCMSIWNLDYAVIHHPFTSYDTSRIWVNIGSLGWIGLGPAMLAFTHMFTGHGDKLKKWWYHGLTTLPFIVFFWAQLNWLIVDELVRQPYGWTHTWAPTFWTPLFIIFYVSMYVWSLTLLVRFQRQTQRRTLKSLARMLSGIILICLVLASITDTVLPLLEIRWVPSMGPLVILIWACGLVYALVKYNFLTITPATAADNILATISDMLVLCDPHGKIVTANRAASVILGHAPKDLKGQSLLQFIQDPNADDAGSFHSAFGHKAVESARMNLKTSKGFKVPVMLSSSLLTDDKGELAGTVTVAKDISALQQAERSLRASEKRHRELVENINDVIFTIDPNGIVTYVSPRIKALAGYTPQELMGRHIKGFVPVEEHPKLMERMAIALKRETGPTNYRMIKKDGTLTWVRVSGRPIFRKGRSTGMLGVLADISRLMKTMDEKLELEAKLNRAQKMEAIGTLAGGVAHDLNNILSGITSYPDLLLMDLPRESDLRQPLEVIRGSGIRAATIVQDLLTLARRGVANSEVLNINQMIKLLLESPEYKKLSSYYPEASVKVELSSNLHNMEGSVVHLTKSVINLLSNAFEALEENGRILIRTSNREIDEKRAEEFSVQAGAYVQIRVQDNGMGIAAEDLDHIFEPFYTKKVMGRSGTGLGMAVVWGTVHDHKGFLDVHSKPGNGTHIDLYFPKCDKALPKKKGPVPVTMYKGGNERILVVDDVAEQRQIAADILTALGYTVKVVASGEEAVALMQKESADLLLLDMIMDPGMDGLETFEKILKINPQQKVILASGYAETERVHKAMELGAFCYLQKPYSIDAVAMSVRSALDQDNDSDK